MPAETVQCPFRLTAQTRDDFKAACASMHESQQGALEKFVEGYIQHAQRGHVYHLDGSLCPITATLESLAQAVALEARHRMMLSAPR